MKLRTIIENHAATALGITAGQAEELRRAFAARGHFAVFEASHLGRGGGPEATPYSVALIALAAWSCVPRSTEAPALAPLLYNTTTAGSDVGQLASAIVGDEAPDVFTPCPITHRGCFGEALAAILGDVDLARQIDRIEIRRGAWDFVVQTRDGRSSRFVSDDDRRRGEAQDALGQFRVVVVIGGGALAAIALDVGQ